MKEVQEMAQFLDLSIEEMFELLNCCEFFECNEIDLYF